MDSEGKQDCEELLVSPEWVTVQESEVNASSPTSSSNNPELGTEALARLEREVLEEVFAAKIQGISETLQARCVDSSPMAIWAYAEAHGRVDFGTRVSG
ncbi:hypothetical protein J1N35_043262 [Gossypium stocksii]|uniref:Uncharacterized protein n=1 Tax=Gossypium stocksii TaxID=47602 RepID=A0A9D3ZF84_9ROSI|nr:hypothetical protein J1N35_043262 [Gossypium stocksii]